MGRLGTVQLIIVCEGAYKLWASHSIKTLKPRETWAIHKITLHTEDILAKYNINSQIIQIHHWSKF